jgi:hypothetical protein
MWWLTVPAACVQLHRLHLNACFGLPRTQWAASLNALGPASSLMQQLSLSHLPYAADGLGCNRSEYITRSRKLAGLPDAHAQASGKVLRLLRFDCMITGVPGITSQQLYPPTLHVQTLGLVEVVRVERPETGGHC